MTMNEAGTRTHGPSVSDAERERTVEILRKHYETGHIGYAEFNDRMERAYQATSAHELPALVSDLPGGQRPPNVPAVAPASPSRRRPNTARILAIVGLVIAAMIGVSWVTSVVAAHPLLTVLAVGAVVFVAVKKPFRRRA